MIPPGQARRKSGTKNDSLEDAVFPCQLQIFNRQTLPPECPSGLPGNFARFAQIATTETNASGETVTVLRTVAFEYALLQKLNAFFGRESHPPPGRNQPPERSG